MFFLTAMIALFALAVVAVEDQPHYGSGMFLLPFLGIRLMLLIGTYYQPGLGACGAYNSPTDYIVAVAAATFDSYPYVTCLGKSSIARELTAASFKVVLDQTRTSR
jgi:hypothetical protein